MKQHLKQGITLLILCLITLLTSIAVSAMENEFIIDQNGILTKYHGSGGNIAIPHGVKVIGNGENSPFENSQLSIIKVSIPDSVTNINEEAFMGCESLIQVTIPESVKEISDYAFSGCHSLKEINLPQSVTYIGRSAFRGCFAEEITLPPNLKSISAYTFSRSNLKKIVIPNRVETIYDRVFYDCPNLEAVIIPPNVTIMTDEIFASCNKVTIYGERGSTAERYANEWGIPFIAVIFGISSDIFELDKRVPEPEEILNIESKCATSSSGGLIDIWDYLVYYNSDGINFFKNTIYGDHYSLKGNVTGAMVSPSAVYFVMDGNLYSFTFDEKEKLLCEDMDSFQKFLGMIGGKIYFESLFYHSDTAEIQFISYDPQTGKQRQYFLEHGKGSVESMIAGNHLFYIGGKTDIGLTPLYELNLETGESRKLDEYAMSMVFDASESLYYMSFETSDYRQSNMILKRYHLITQETENIFQDRYENTGSLVMVNKYGAFFQLYTSNAVSLKRLDLNTYTLETLHTLVNTTYVPDCHGNDFYYSSCNDYGDCRLYRYDGYHFSYVTTVKLDFILGIGKYSLYGYDINYDKNADYRLLAIHTTKPQLFTTNWEWNAN